MTKNRGPYFEFMVDKDGAKVEFIFLPGNVAPNIFETTKNTLHGAFKKHYLMNASDYVREVNLDDGLNTVAFYQTKILTVILMILESAAFRDFKVKLTGLNNQGERETLWLDTPEEVKEYAKGVIPYFNKNDGNDLTTRRK